MGKDIFEEFSFVREIFEMAEDISKNHISRLCFEGPMADLTKTVNLQPAITTVSLAFLSILEKEKILPGIAAGHSLGEYGALCSAGAITKEDAIRLVNVRGQLMHRESMKHKGAMHAVIGLDVDSLSEIVENAREIGVVSVANHNTKLQIVTTGSPEPVKEVSRRASDRGAKTIPLKVSGAWHSELIKGAEKEFSQHLRDTPFKKPEKPVIHNLTADLSPSDPDGIRNIMKDQLCNPVKWYDSVRKLMEMDVKTYVEIGPGKVLTGLVKKILPKDSDAAFYSINSLKALEAFL
jgi:[acyl-carrier-protein] S-malonyltransferase